MNLAKLIRDVPDFPVEGVLFKDITTLLRVPEALREAVDILVQRYENEDIDQVAAIESRGFIFGGALAYHLDAGFVPIRKQGKLPAKTVEIEYSLEYGSNVLEMHTDGVEAGEKVLLVDDLLATGGSAKASIELIERVGGIVMGAAFLIELEFLEGIKKLEGYDVFTVIRF